jgi:hypothetical protein
MDALAKSLFMAPLPTLFIIAGIIFLFVGVVGSISGKIEPSTKSRVASGIIGCLFVSLGLIMHFSQQPPSAPLSPVASPPQTKTDPPETPSQKPLTSSAIPKQEATPRSQPVQKSDVLSAPIQTKYAGIVANIVRFEKSGEFVLLQVIARNTSSENQGFCFTQMGTDLIDEATGDTWRPKEFSGPQCTTVEASKSTQTWIKFAIPTPEKRTFSLSAPFFNGTLDNLVLAGPS